MKGRRDHNPSGRERFNDLMRNIGEDAFPRSCLASMGGASATQIVLRERIEAPSNEISETVTISRCEYNRLKEAETVIRLMLKGIRTGNLDKYACGGMIETISNICDGDILNFDYSNIKTDSGSTDSASTD